MNDDFTNLEDELRGLAPRRPSRRLTERIGQLVDQAAPQPMLSAWWQRLGFNRPLAAFGWGVLSPTLTAAVVAIILPFPRHEPVSRSSSHRSSAGSDPSAASAPIPVVNPLTPSAGADSAQAASIVYQATDEGVVLDGGHEPVHRVRYQAADLVRWRNPSTGARWEISYPREEVRLVPVEVD